MRLSHRSLGLFVPGVPFDPQNPVFINLRKRGTGEFLPAKAFDPQNPVFINLKKRGAGDFVSGCFAVPQNPVSDAGMNGLGDDVPTSAMYPIPQNSVLAAFQSGGISQSGGLAGLGCGCGGKCGCGGSCGGGMSGLGQISNDLATLGDDFSSFTAALTSGNFTGTTGAFTEYLPLMLQDTVAGIPVWGYVAVVAIAAYAFSGSGGGRRRR